MPRTIKKLPLTDFAPEPVLKVHETPLQKAKFPVIDFHNHLGSSKNYPAWAPRWKKIKVKNLLREMDKSNVEAVVNLDGGRKADITEALNRYTAPHPKRFITFKAINWENHVKHNDMGARAAAELREAVEKGARGLKIFKSLGLILRDAKGKTIMPGDPRLAPLWDEAAKLKIPVLIHVADPPAFFTPMNRYNERWEELNGHPTWRFYKKRFPDYDRLLKSQEKLFARHKKTIFVSAHVLNSTPNLAYARRVLKKYKNVYVDISARLAELGRQPRTARKFYLEYPDRILFGTDATPKAEMYRLYFRYHETRDEHFPYSPNNPPWQGRWCIYGIGLPDAVLRKVYYGNAKKLLGMR